MLSFLYRHYHLQVQLTDPAVEFDWIRATIPFVEVPVLATFKIPLVEFKELFEVVKLSRLPVVNALADIVIGFLSGGGWPVQVLRIVLVLSIEFSPVAPVMAEYDATWKGATQVKWFHWNERLLSLCTK